MRLNRSLAYAGATRVEDTDDAEVPWGEFPASRITYDTLTRDEIGIVRATAFVLGVVIFCCKFAVPPNIEVSYFFVTPYVGWMLYRGYASMGPIRSIAFALTMIAVVAVTLFSPLAPAFSPTSVLFLIVIHLPFLFTANVRRIVYLNVLKWFALFCMIIAGFVFFQWAQQLVGMKMISMESIVPQKMLFDNYNYIQKVNFFSKYYKPNAFFMLETSHTSQLLAMGLLVEFCVLRRVVRFMILSIAMLISLGGTGIFIVLGSLPALLFYLRIRSALAIAIAVPLLFAAALQSGALDNIASRATEFDKNGTSGNGRFVRPFQITVETLKTSRDNALFGIGGGADNPLMVYKQTDLLPPYAKMLTEYGIPIAFAFLLWFHLIVFTSGTPVVVMLAVLLQYDVVGSALMIPLETYYVFLLAAFLVPNRLKRTVAMPAGADRRVRAGRRPLGAPRSSAA